MRRPCVLLLLALTARAEWWGDDATQRFSSRNAKHVLVGAIGERKTTLELKSAEGRLLAKNVLPIYIVEVDVLDQRPAAVLFEQFLKSVMLIDATGIVWQVPARKLYDPNKPHASANGHVLWRRAWWTDEARGKVVLVSYAGSVREIDLKTGTVKTAAPEIILTGVKLPWARKAALEAAADFEPKGVRAVAEPLAQDESQPVAVRLRAAIAVERVGGAEVNTDLFTAAAAPEESLADRQYAVREAPYVLGDEAFDWLEETAVRFEDLTKEVIKALVPLAGKAVRSLVYLIAHSEVQPGARKYAAKFLPQLPKDLVLKATLRELKDADARIGGVLLGAAIATGAKDLGDRMREHDQVLLDILAKQTGPLEWLTDYFRDRPTSEAVKPLLNALRKHRRNPARRAKIIAALKPCTGLDFGDNVDAWLKNTPRN
ncbi:MAG: hypothetical protein ACYTF8_01775 [Planctomycetota bacterium]|jgi:hypothetical protein